MNGTNVSNTILERLAGELPALTPEARKAATYVLENPRDVGVSTVREIAEDREAFAEGRHEALNRIGVKGLGRRAVRSIETNRCARFRQKMCGD